MSEQNQAEQQQIQTEPLVVKEKDYVFYYKQRNVKSEKTDVNWLAYDAQVLAMKARRRKGKVANNQMFNKGKFGAKKPLTLGAQKLLANAQNKYKRETQTNKSNVSNPLQSNNPLNSKPKMANNPLMKDPLSKKAKDPLSKQFNPLAASGKPKKKVQEAPQNEVVTIESIQITEKQIKQVQNQNTSQQEFNMKQGGYWQDIRDEYVKIFGIKPSSSKMTQMVVNPFGSQAIKNEDRQFLKQAQSGQTKMEYGNTPQAESGQKELQKITIKNYLSLLEEKYEKMQQKWDDGDKVGALQITIQQVKLLIENENPRFSPMKYVYVIDIMEQFGRNVFQRMKSVSFPNKSEDELKNVTIKEIEGANIQEQTQEIARNWLKKVGSIRELLPRMYIEVALLPILHFIDSSKILPAIDRLAKMTRAIGDYINSMYFANFLMRMVAEIAPKYKSHILSLIQDFFFYIKQGPKFFGKPGMGSDEYWELFSPFLNTAFRYYCNQCSDSEFYDLFETFKNSNQHQEVLKKIIDIFPPQYIAQYAGPIFGIIQNYHVDVKAQVYFVFLPKISQTVTNKTALEQICKLVWLDLVQIKSLNTFLNILATLIDLIQKSFVGYQKTKFYHDILDKFNELFNIDKTTQSTIENQKREEEEKEVSEDIFNKLENFLVDILEGSDNVNEIITIDPFIQFISFFPAERRPKVSINILKIYLKKDDQNDSITDPVTVHSIISIANHVNQSIVLKEEYKYALIQVLKSILKKINFGKDLEQMLNLYTDIRGNFGNFSPVIEELLYRVIDLTFQARKLSKNRMNKKVIAFLQACIAFCYITIPMVQDISKQFQFIGLCASVSLVHNLVSQSEAILKNGITILSDLPEQVDGKNLDQLLQGQLKSMISFMVVLPDDPEHDYLHLFSGFYRLVEVFKWSKKNGELYKLSLLQDFIKYLCIQIQEKLPYHIEGVISNDQLFAEPEFKEKIVDYLQNCLVDVKKTQQDIMTRQSLSTDIYTSVGLIKQNLELINTLLQYFRPNNNIKQIIKTALEICEKRGQQLINEKIGKIHLRNHTAFIENTIQNLEKNEVLIENFEQLKTRLVRIVEESKLSIL